MKRVLAVWLPNWPVQRRVASRPELAGQTLVIYERHARDGSRVKACSAAAWDAGIRPGMPLAEAQTLGQKEPTAGPRVAGPAEAKTAAPFFLTHEALHDREALTALAEWCQKFSPLVGLDTAEEPDCLLLDVSGVAQLFGGEEGLARQVVSAFRQRGLDLRVAIADTPSAAWAVARWPIATSGRESFSAPAQTTGGDFDRKKTTIASPSLYRIVPPGSPDLLDDLPIEALRLPERSQQQLAQLGIAQLGSLRRLPRAGLAARFGDVLVRRLDQLWGAAAEVLVAHQAPPDWQTRWLFDPPTTQRETIHYVVGQLLEQLAQRLRPHQQGALQLECGLVCPPRPPRQLQVGLFQPSADPRHWWSLLQLQLDQVRLADAVEEIRVVATATGPLTPRQRELFACPTRDEPAALAALIERVSSRLGRARVVQPQLQAEAQVEFAYRCRPLTGESPAPTATSSLGKRTRPAAPPAVPAPAPLGPLLRPLRLFDPPVPVAVIGIALDGPPALFHYHRQPYRVARCFGPERIETGWWRGPSSRRDYYRVETDSGQRFWLFRELQAQQWFLHGSFE